jgi:hypothetical protein
MRRLPDGAVPGDDDPRPEQFDADALTAMILTVGDGLNALAFDVISPQESEFSYLKVTNARDALCELTIDKIGTVTWEYRCAGPQPDPVLLAAMAMRILCGTATVSVPEDPRLTFKGKVGRALADAGMQTALKVMNKDELFMEVYAEVEITNTRLPGRGTIEVADEGAMWWHCHLHEPEVFPDGPQIDEVTATIADVLAIGQSVRCG